jgi:hypothetical protein
MLSPELEEKLHRARFALDEATSDNLIELCKRYLGLLAMCRAELYELPDKLALDPKFSSTGGDTGGARKAVRAAIEHTTRERNQVETLLLSFTAVSGYEAVKTLNSGKYEGQDTWELRASGIGCTNGHGKRMSIQEAVETASRLRREEHIADAATGTNAQRPLANLMTNRIEQMKEAHDDSL